MVSAISARQQTTQLLVIDQNINGWQDLANNAGIGVSVLILDPLQDGLTQIANAVTAYSNLDAIQILSHGSVASLQLGATTLNSDNLSHYTEQLTTIGNALSENGDLLLYGCNVAQGDAGQQFIEQLSVLTGADVAASTNLTGDVAQGGDWLLETQTGAIEASSAISVQAQAAYHSTLATTLGVFAATDATNGTELWVTDGTAAGTSLLKDIYVGILSSSPHAITSLGNGKAVFVATGITSPSNYSYDVWITDGTTSAILVKDIRSPYSDSQFFFTSLGNGKALFSGSFDANLNRNLWVTDGTAAGTNTIVVGSFIYYPESIVVLGNGKALFSAHDSTNGSGLWITDGSTAGTSLVKGSFNPTFSPDPPQYLTSLGNGKALFNAPSSNGYGLWITDGTTAGTGLFKDIVAGIDNARPIFLGNGKAVLDVYNATTGHELWFTDGTALGTHFVKNGMGSFDSTSFTTLGNGKVLFSTTLGLWVTDETTAGTTLVKNIFIGTGNPYSQIITSLGNGKAVFSAYDSTNGYELWVTDGTTAGTNLVKDINVGINGSKPQFFTALGNGKATFSATDANNDTELWITDGTAAGTSLLKDINPATQSSSPSAVTLITGTNTNTNTAPNVLAGSTTVFTEQTPVTVAGTMTINDLNGDADWNGGKLQVQITANNTINDSLALPTANNGGIWLNPTGNVLMANTTIIGTANATTVSNGSVWTFIFNASATNALVQSTARAIQFINNSDAPSTASRTVTFTATDKNAAFNSSVQTVSIAAVNDAPSLTNFTSTVANGNEDSEIAVTFASLQAQGNEADVDGTVTAFVIKAVTSGTLKIGTDALTATAWSASNNTVDATHQAYWTPALNANGTLNAFTAVAKDNGGLESLTAIQATVSIVAVNDAPTLTSFTSTVANGNEDSEIAVTFASLQAQGNEADADGTVTAFVIKAVTSGTLKIGTDALTATAWSASNNTVDATHQAYWTPALNANGTLNAFTAVAKDNGGLESLTAIQATVSIVAVNDAPTLTSFTSTVANGNEDSEIAVTFASLQAQGNEADADGTVTAFVIKAVTSGTLKIGTDALTATAWSASNNTVDATHQAYWTPALNTSGTLNAFTAVAKDNGGLESLTPVQATVSIGAVNDTPTLTSFTSTVANGNEDSEIAVTFASLQAQGNEADADGTVTAFVIKAVNSGTLKIGTDALTATAWSASNNTVDATHQGYWTPALNANGTLNAFTVVAKDNGGLESLTPVQAKVSVVAVNDAPIGVADYVGITETGRSVFAVGNVLFNDTDVDGGGPNVVNAVNNLNTNVGNTVAGVYGSLQLMGNGNYVYTLDNTKAATNALTIGQVVTDTFTYRSVDAYGASSAATPLVVYIVGRNYNVLPTASQLFNSALTPEEKSVVGGEQAGMIRTMADFAKAAYHLEANENKVINDISPNADAAFTALTTQGWVGVNLYPILSATLGIAGQTISNGMFDNGFYINGNAAALVERCGDAIVLSFRGTNDNGKDGVVNPNDPYNVNNPDVDQWSNMSSYYARLQPLIDAFDAYVAANGIGKVYVTGHSMGGAAALEYMSRHSGSQYQAVTFGAPPFTQLNGLGITARKDYSLDSRITQIEIVRDPVPMAFDIQNLVGSTNSRPAGHIIDFGGDQTLDAPNLEVVPWVSNYYARDANHSMDYYRQITDSVDADSWTKILARTGTQTVLLGGQQITGTSDFIVDGQRSGTNTSVSNGGEYLASLGFKVIYGGKGSDMLVAGTNATLLLGGVGDDVLIGGTSNDSLDGGLGTDIAVYGAWAAYTVTGAATSATVTTLIGTGGIDTLSSIEYLTFNNITVTTAAAVNDAPVGVLDNNANDAVIEASSNVAGDNRALGNVLNNDTDADSTLGLGETKTVKTVNNLTANVGNAVAGVYGSLFLSANGTYTYILDNTKAATNALTAGQVVTDTFTYTVVDAHGASSAATTLTINVTGSNDAPTLTSFNSVVASGNEDRVVTVTFANLIAQGNEADVDGLVTAFVINAVNSGGTLKIGTDALTATEWSASNNTVDATHQAYWTPPFNANGLLNIFTAVAKDNGGLVSSTPVQAMVSIAPVNNAPVLNTPSTINYIDTAFVDGFVTKTGFLVGSDVDSGTTFTYGITNGTDNFNGTVSKTDAYGTLTITKATGVYSFAPNSAGIEPLIANTTSTFTVTVSDDFLIVSKPLTIAIKQSGITESNGSDVLLNGVGVNHWAGLQGDDTYYVDVAGDVITENVGGGTDIVYSTATSYILADNVENLVIWGAGVNGTGNALSNYIFGSTGNNTIDGGLGADIMYGDLGSDAYYVDNIGDVTVEIGTDWDVVYSTAASYTLNANIEVLFLIDGVNRNGNGNSQNNYLLGNTGNNILDGKGGADVMVGYAGNDTYYVDNVGDSVIENASEGFDTVNSSINYTLTANVEALTLMGAATQGFGNNLNNTLTGNSANNVLGGGVGADTMIGGVGNDTYYVDDALDSIIENVGEGADIVYSTAASYTLADNVESLIIWGAGVNGTGSNQANYIISGAGNNMLDGRAGNDVLYGDEGADTYIGGLGVDSLNLTEATAATDTVRVATGDSLAALDGYDLVTRFKLGTGMLNTTGVDKLDLANTVIAANVTAADGIDSGVIRSHSINNGIISFDDINNYTSPLAISASTNLVNVFSYLQTNITGGNTVAFISEGNTFVFQDGGVTDTLVELLGVNATNVNNTGLGANSVWVI